MGVRLLLKTTKGIGSHIGGEYSANSYIWNKKIRDLIKSWFVSAIGLLVIKGWLTVLPVMDIE